jgi:hypothetical protein
VSHTTLADFLEEDVARTETARIAGLGSRRFLTSQGDGADITTNLDGA